MTSAQKKDYAKQLYMRHIEQKEIAQRVGMSVRTIQNWIGKGNWKAERAAMSVSTANLIPKVLAKADEILSGDIFDAAAADKLAKIVKTLSQFGKGISVVEEIDVFMAFSNWLNRRIEVDGELTGELIRKINHFQNIYVTERVAQNGK